MLIRRKKKEKPKNEMLVRVVTLVRIPVALVFAVFLVVFYDQHAENLMENTNLLLAAWGMIAIIEGTDILDGFLARQLDSVTEFGAMLDPFADSVSRVTVFWSLAHVGLAMPAVPLVLAIRDVTVAYCRIRLVQENRSVAANLSGKTKAVVQGFGAAGLVLAPLYAHWTGLGCEMELLSWTVMIATAASAVQYVVAALIPGGEA